VRLSFSCVDVWCVVVMGAGLGSRDRSTLVFLFLFEKLNGRNVEDNDTDTREDFESSSLFTFLYDML
jgi:hypothetical protein